MSHARPLPSMLVVLLAACAAPPDGAVGSAEADGTAPVEGPAPAAWPFTMTTALGHPRGAFVPMGVRRSLAEAIGASAAARSSGDAPPPPPPPAPTPSPAARILPSLTGGTFDRAYGSALTDAIAALPEERAALGLTGVDGESLFAGDLCEDPHVLLDVDGAEVSLTVPWGAWFAGAPARDLQPLPEDCVASLLDAGGVSGSVCESEAAHAHYPEDSECRACLEEDGDHARCVEAEACPETATRQITAGGRWYGVLRAPALLCAPDHVGDLLVLVENLAEEDPLPETFDHGAVAGLCFEAWDGEGVGLYCSLGDHNALGDVLYSRVDHIRSATGPEWAGRLSLVASVEVEGWPFAYSWLGEVGGTGISAPLGSVADAWGINPRDLRPDGTDPEDPDHTYARDYVAAFTLKLMTERDGVLVNPVNRNRCPDDAWEGPHADGTFSCDEPGAWSTAAWYDDAFVAWWDERAGEIYTFPLVTLASTGLPDPDVPGGLLTEVLGSTTLADPEWEGCAWPKTFVPDRVRLYDPAPATSDLGYASFDGQTYRLGRDPDTDVRLFLATSQLRGFCPS